MSKKKKLSFVHVCMYILHLISASANHFESYEQVRDLKSQSLISDFTSLSFVPWFTKKNTCFIWLEAEAYVY
jgi:hypothetical protein